MDNSIKIEALASIEWLQDHEGDTSVSEERSTHIGNVVAALSDPECKLPEVFQLSVECRSLVMNEVDRSLSERTTSLDDSSSSELRAASEKLGAVGGELLQPDRGDDSGYESAVESFGNVGSFEDDDDDDDDGYVTADDEFRSADGDDEEVIADRSFEELSFDDLVEDLESDREVRQRANRYTTAIGQLSDLCAGLENAARLLAEGTSNIGYTAAVAKSLGDSVVKVATGDYIGATFEGIAGVAGAANMWRNALAQYEDLTGSVAEAVEGLCSES